MRWLRCRLSCDPAQVRAHLETLARVADRDPGRAGPIAKMEPSERFHLAPRAPSSTIVQSHRQSARRADPPIRPLQLEPSVLATLVQR